MTVVELRAPKCCLTSCLTCGSRGVLLLSLAPAAPQPRPAVLQEQLEALEADLARAQSEAHAARRTLHA